MASNWLQANKIEIKTKAAICSSPTLPLTTAFSAWSCLHLSHARLYCNRRMLKIKSTSPFWPIIINSSCKPGYKPISLTCLISWMQASLTGKYAKDFAPISTSAPSSSVRKMVPFTWKITIDQTIYPYYKHHYLQAQNSAFSGVLLNEMKVVNIIRSEKGSKWDLLQGYD